MSCCAMRSTKSGMTTSRSGMDDKGKKEYSPGLEGVVAGESALCEVDEGAAGLRYRGYAIGDLAEQATFEEVAYLLLFGKLPTRKELGDFTAQLQTQWPLPGPVEAFIGVVPPSAHPMDILRTGVSLLGMTDPDAADSSRDANLRKSVRLLAQIPILIANAHRLALRVRQAMRVGDEDGDLRQEADGFSEVRVPGGIGCIGIGHPQERHAGSQDIHRVRARRDDADEGLHGTWQRPL